MVTKLFAVFCLFGLCTGEVVSNDSNVDPVVPKPSSKHTFVNAEANYYEATLACKQDGKELVSIETEEEWHEIVDTIKKSISPGDCSTLGPRPLIWTSANSLQEPHSEKFHWMSDGSRVLHNASYWDAEDINDSESDYFCIMISKTNNTSGSEEYHLLNHDCGIQTCYICETKSNC